MGRRLVATNKMRRELAEDGCNAMTAEVLYLSQRVEAQIQRLKKAPDTAKNRGKRFAAEFVLKDLKDGLETCKMRREGLEKGELYDQKLKYTFWADHYLSSKAGKPFVLKDWEGRQRADREIVPKPLTVQELHGRGMVYKTIAQDLGEIADRWKYPKWRSETYRRAYDTHGRMLQPKVGVRPRTVQKILTNRPPDADPFEGGFLDQ